jgi:hypothetical protein
MAEVGEPVERARPERGGVFRRALPARRLPWAELGVEAFAVFLSVMAGFALTAWMEARHERALRQQALDQFAQELAANHAAVRERLGYHTRVEAAFAAAFEAGGRAEALDLDRVLPEWQGPRQISFVETARRAADATGAFALLDFETAGRLSDVYTSQDELKGVQQALVQAGMNPRMFEESGEGATLRALEIYFEMVVAHETTLDGQYRAARARVRAVGGRAGPEPLPPARAPA